MNIPRHGRALALMLFLLPAAVAQKPEPKPQQDADTAANDPALDAAAQTIGRALYLRCLCTADTLRFQALGKLEEGEKTRTVDWTLAGVDVQKAVRKGPETIELNGTRVAVRWADDRKEFDRRPLKEQAIHIVLKGAGTREQMQQTLAAVFSVGLDRALQLATPSYWQHYFQPQMKWPDEPGFDAGEITPVGTKVNGEEIVPPTVAKKANADYTQEAAQNHIQGQVVLQVVVDRTGKAHRVRVAQPLGFGLDAAAVAAVEKTTFAIPQINGKPTNVQFYLKENFSIVPPPTL